MNKRLLSISIGILSFFIANCYTEKISIRDRAKLWEKGPEEINKKPELKRNTSAQNKKLEELRKRKTDWASLANPQKKKTYSEALKLQEIYHITYEEALAKLEASKEYDEKILNGLREDEKRKKDAYGEVLSELQENEKYKRASERFSGDKDRYEDGQRVTFNSEKK